MQQGIDHKNIIIATALSMLILLAWSFFYEQPKLQKQKNNINTASLPKEQGTEDLNKSTTALLNRDQFFAEQSNKQNRVFINNLALHGSISLQGALFDDLTLAQYFTKLNGDQEVVLFSPKSTTERYFADFGWINNDPNTNIELPNPNTIWQASSQQLNPQNPVTLTWVNQQGIEFVIDISLDDKYMFNIKQKIINNSPNSINLSPYGRISRLYNSTQKANFILHEGPIGVFNGILEEFSYQKMVKEQQKTFTHNQQQGSWLGITDKYWLSTLIPDGSLKYQANFLHQLKNQQNSYSIDFTADAVVVPAGQQSSYEHHLFAGAKKVKTLDYYKTKFNLKLFDRAIDFGWFYFLTKPFFFIIDFLYGLLGNFGLAILCMTVLVKLALFPLANKSYGAMARIKKLQPKIDALRKKNTDKLSLNSAIMDLYKKEKINPASGCLPVLIQVPIFFALYKVFFVTLDMRHAPFYGWISDLSVPDPTSIFNLFGLLPFKAPILIGIWPILMGITMFLQQKVSPPTSDPIQAKVLKMMPIVLTVLLASFPSGLVIYWTWSNTLSILQQLYINHKHKK
jgi:YidC/Oxa1 family membrane protein insertase